MLRRIFIIFCSAFIVSNAYSQIEFQKVLGGINGANYEFVSNYGPQINDALTKLSQDQKKNAQIVAFIKQSAVAGVPEAINGLGWLSDSGYFGVPKNSELARQYFESASSLGLAAARYNLASMAFWGRGEKANIRKAYNIVSQIHSPKDSASGGHICGLASFMAWRMGKKSEAADLAKGCDGPLALVAKIYQTNDYEFKVRYAIASLAITSDAYPIMLDAAKNNPQEYCVWTALELAKNATDIDRYGSKCITENPSTLATAVGRKGAILGAKQSNNIHFSASVPFLPYSIDQQKKFESFNPQ